jgi:hypothetical protein
MVAAGILMLLAAPALVAGAQTSALEFRIAGTPAQSATQLPAPIYREIDDPSTGDRWLLVPGHAGGPGTLILAGHCERARCGEANMGTRSAPAADPAADLPVIHAPVIRAGEAVIVEEHTAVVDVRLEAVALNPGRMGSTFEARLKIGGNVVRVRAVAPGRAILSEDER